MMNAASRPEPGMVEDEADILRLYDLESYLFDVVGPRFRTNGCLDAFDFFSIVIWKANRAKSRIAKRLLGSGAEGLETAVRELTTHLAGRPQAKDRLRYLWVDRGFRLPMASAILTMLYPEEFTIYDTRVCDSLGGFHSLADSSDFDCLWDGYVAFLDQVRQAAPEGLSLRDKDRYLWARSFRDQLREDIKREFGGLST